MPGFSLIVVIVFFTVVLFFSLSFFYKSFGSFIYHMFENMIDEMSDEESGDTNDSNKED